MVSSYIPSLSSLLRSRDDAALIRCEELKAVLVAESSAPGATQIGGVEEEIYTIAGLLQSVSASVINDVNTKATIRPTLEKLPAAHILHLASHGHQEKDALQSCFALNDGPLTISALMKLNLPNALFAFLSACETAKGDQNQPDQAVHLAASLLFCGFRSVIGTMW
jgi:CHAT domain-containing protein